MENDIPLFLAFFLFMSVIVSNSNQECFIFNSVIITN